MGETNKGIWFNMHIGGVRFEVLGEFTGSDCSAEDDALSRFHRFASNGGSELLRRFFGVTPPLGGTALTPVDEGRQEELSRLRETFGNDLVRAMAERC